MNDIEIENKILEKLSPYDEISSNKLFLKIKIKISKPRFTKIKNNMINQGWITLREEKTRDFLKRSIFEAPKFDEDDWTNITRINCTNWLKYFIDRKPLFNKKKKIRTKNLKFMLDAYFQELDRQMIVNTRLVNAEALGLIRSSRQDFIRKSV